MKTDGAGVTSLVALGMCPLACRYCINKNVTHAKELKKVTVKALLEKLLIDYCYYIATGGGVTFGGGEPLLQIDAILEFMDIIPEGMNVNVETSLNVKMDDNKFEKFVTQVSELIIDIKAWDKDIYKSYTKRDIDETRHKLFIIKELNLQGKCKIRIPVIPNFTTKEDAEKYAEEIRSEGFNNIEIFDYVIRDYMTED